jgi:hypothetical protein
MERIKLLKTTEELTRGWQQEQLARQKNADVSMKTKKFKPEMTAMPTSTTLCVSVQRTRINTLYSTHCA